MAGFLKRRKVAGAGSLLTFVALMTWSGCKRAAPPASSPPPSSESVPQAAEPLSSAPVGAGKDFRILYVGHGGTDRERDFVSFLKQHFGVVQTGNLQAFKETDARGFDVTLLDWDVGVLDGPRLEVSEGFSRPVITIGVRGALICRWSRLKTGYL